MSIINLVPLREPRANQISTSIYFYSPKLNRQVWCESNLEFDAAIVLDHDPCVLEYCEQSVELEWSKSKWIPDFVAVLEVNGKYKVFILEIKYMKELLGDKRRFKQKFSETQQWIDSHKHELSKQITSLPVQSIELLIVTELVLQQSFRVRNLRKLVQSEIENQYDFALSLEMEKIMEQFSQIPIKSDRKSTRLNSSHYS